MSSRQPSTALLLALLAGCATQQRRATDMEPPESREHRLSDPVRSETHGVSAETAALENARRAVQQAEHQERIFAAPDAPQSMPAVTPWHLWQAYSATFITTDGRVVDRGNGEITTSEGQAYGLFFALVANDRERFASLLRWTETNLAGGSLRASLPAWRWGRDKHGRWRVLDTHAASDADLWIAYALIEAARLWGEPRYQRLARKLLQHVVAAEVRELPGLGPMLLPGPAGFVIEPKRMWRLNPSYLPLQLLRRLETAGMPGPWTAMQTSTRELLRGSCPEGFAPDWLVYRVGQGFGVDPQGGPVGSYDAIRVYLWVAMLAPQAPERAVLLRITDGLYRSVRATGRVPARIDVRDAQVLDAHAPPGFVAVAQLQAMARGDEATATDLARQLDASLRGGLYGNPPRYYDQNLAMFARGYIEGRFRFEVDGRLRVPWEGDR